MNSHLYNNFNFLDNIEDNLNPNYLMTFNDYNKVKIISKNSKEKEEEEPLLEYKSSLVNGIIIFSKLVKNCKEKSISSKIKIKTSLFLVKKLLKSFINKTNISKKESILKQLSIIVFFKSALNQFYKNTLKIIKRKRQKEKDFI